MTCRIVAADWSIPTPDEQGDTITRPGIDVSPGFDAGEVHAPALHLRVGRVGSCQAAQATAYRESSQWRLAPRARGGWGTWRR